MKRPCIFHFMGSSYAAQVDPYLQTTFPHWHWLRGIDPREVPSIGWTLVSPTPDETLSTFLAQLPPQTKTLLLLDYNHQGFDDGVRLLTQHRFRLVLSPFAIPGRRLRHCPSLSVSQARALSIPAPRNRKDIFLVSQPLREDRRPGPDQLELLRATLRVAERENVQLHVKRHPRENIALPADLRDHPRVHLWDKTIEQAYEEFHRWFGLNSLPLFIARDLGREVSVWLPSGDVEDFRRME